MNAYVASITVSARDLDEAKKLLEQQLQSFGKSVKNFKFNEIVESREYPGAIPVTFDLGLVSQHRSIAKSALTYLATTISPERLRSGCFSKVIEYIFGGKEELRLTTITKADFPSTPNISEVQHRVLISASEHKKYVIGLIELFGNIRFKVVLTDSWDGPDLQKGYAVNPLNGEQVEQVGMVNLSDDHWSGERSKFNEDAYKDMMSKVFKSAYDHHVELERNRIISEVTKDFCKEFDGQDFTDKLNMELSSRIGKAIANSVYRVDENRRLSENDFEIK